MHVYTAYSHLIPQKEVYLTLLYIVKTQTKKRHTISGQLAGDIVYAIATFHPQTNHTLQFVYLREYLCIQQRITLV